MNAKEFKKYEKRNRKCRMVKLYGSNRTRQIQSQDARLKVLLTKVNDPSTSLDELREISAQIQAMKAS